MGEHSLYPQGARGKYILAVRLHHLLGVALQMRHSHTIAGRGKTERVAHRSFASRKIQRALALASRPRREDSADLMPGRKNFEAASRQA